jgi:hypothetical protein
MQKNAYQRFFEWQCVFIWKPAQHERAWCSSLLTQDRYATLGTYLPRRLRSTRLTGWSPNQTRIYWNIRGSFFYTRAQQKAANFSLSFGAQKTRMAFSDELLVQHFYKAGGDEANRFYCCTAGGWEFLFMYAAARQKCRCRVKYQWERISPPPQQHSEKSDISSRVVGKTDVFRVRGEAHGVLLFALAAAGSQKSNSYMM